MCHCYLVPRYVRQRTTGSALSRAQGPLARRSPVRGAYLVAHPWPWAGQAIITNHSIIFQLCPKYSASLHSAVPGGGLITRYRYLRPPGTYRNAKLYTYRSYIISQADSTPQRHRAVSGALHQGLLGPHSSAFSDCIARAPTRRTRRSPYVDLHTITSSRNTLVKSAE